MKKSIYLLIICCCFSALLKAQSSQKQERSQTSSEQVESLDQIIASLYSVISGEKGQERDWELMKFLFHPDAKLISSGRNSIGEYKVQYMSPDDYINASGKWLVENGFFEKEIHRTVNTFGNITHVFSTYECFKSEADEQPFMRGINSIQLLHDGKRWWIINIYWTQESKDKPIPEEYLPEN